MKRETPDQLYFYRDRHIDAALDIIKQHLQPQMQALGVSDVTNRPVIMAALRETVQHLDELDWTQYVENYMLASNTYRRSATFLDTDSMNLIKDIQRHIRSTSPPINIKKGKKAPLMMCVYVAIRFAAERFSAGEPNEAVA